MYCRHVRLDNWATATELATRMIAQYVASLIEALRYETEAGYDTTVLVHIFIADFEMKERTVLKKMKQ